MKREIPLLLTIIFGLLMIVDFFVPHPARRRARAVAPRPGDHRDGVRVRPRRGERRARSTRARSRAASRDWPYATALLAGVRHDDGARPRVRRDGGQGRRGAALFNNLFLYAYTPMQATMFALLAFYIASAAFRAFRVRTVEAALLAVTAVLVMIGRVPVGAAISDALHLPPALSLETIESWIMDVPNLAAKRADPDRRGARRDRDRPQDRARDRAELPRGDSG